ncbi:hypothetical protein COB64_02790 [Candidatus Wolfebacteria bacterium]|nr:MAG: hypothetical protein COB64_02790 [Candidatus Wolfebacteria bacterium]
MTDVKEIFDLFKTTPTEADMKKITQAYEFAEEAHREQKRNSGEPYFVHVFEVGKNLARLGMDIKTIQAGLLHDTIEDTDITEDDIEKKFGKSVLFLVNGVTKLGTLKYKGRERHVESLRKFFIAMSEDVRVIVIKLADRLHNMQTLEHVRPDKQRRIALETLEIHAPLASRLGMGKLKAQLEDLAFPYVFPEEYELVKDLLRQRSKVDEKFKSKLRTTLAKEIAKHDINNVTIDARIKHKYSLWQKLKRKNMDIEKIDDIIALRVIVPTIEDSYRVLGIVHKLWRPLPGRIKDYIAFPKPNGYQSLHTNVLTSDGGIAEIQMRTNQMHQEAEYGIAAHFTYKESASSAHPKKLGKSYEWIEEMKELQQGIAEPNKFLEHLKMDFFRDRIFVFTPEGDVVDIPEGSSPIDFAYRIHSDIGNHVSGSKINGKMSTLSTKLVNGDIVEIVTKKSAHPTNKWLDYSKTSLAKKHIRAYLQENSLFKKFFKG